MLPAALAGVGWGPICSFLLISFPVSSLRSRWRPPDYTGCQWTPHSPTWLKGLQFQTSFCISSFFSSSRKVLGQKSPIRWVTDAQMSPQERAPVPDYRDSTRHSRRSHPAKEQLITCNCNWNLNSNCPGKENSRENPLKAAVNTFLWLYWAAQIL